jgi:hypothetical protein
MKFVNMDSVVNKIQETKPVTPPTSFNKSAIAKELFEKRDTPVETTLLKPN